MKENESIFPWKDWARFEAVDPDGVVIQFADRPTFTKRWFLTQKSTYILAGRWNQPEDASKTLIERYSSEQVTPAPFVFGPEHVGKRVKHVDGSNGTVEAINMESSIDNQLIIKWDGRTKCAYSLRGIFFDDSNKVEVFLDESETYTAQPLQALTDRVSALEAQLKTQLDISQEFTQRIAILEDGIQTLLPNLYAPIASGSDGVSFDDLRFFVNNTQPDPTAQKVEALKLLFEWRDGCEFMTVDPDGDVWQWSVAPIRQGLSWTSLGAAEISEKIGEIPLCAGLAELSKILITRTNG